MAILPANQKVEIMRQPKYEILKDNETDGVSRGFKKGRLGGKGLKSEEGSMMKFSSFVGLLRLSISLLL